MNKAEILKSMLEFAMENGFAENLSEKDEFTALEEILNTYGIKSGE